MSFYVVMDYRTHQLADQLARAEVFGLLTPAERLELAGVAHRKALKKGDVLCYQGDEHRFALYIAEGVLRSVINAPDGREYVVSTWEAGRSSGATRCWMTIPCLPRWRRSRQRLYTSG